MQQPGRGRWTANRSWHERQITAHLPQLTDIRDRADDSSRRLEAVLEAYALIAHQRGHRGVEIGALLHQDEQVTHAQQHLYGFIRDLLVKGAKTGDIRDDIPPDELAGYCLHALAAGGNLTSEAAVRRLVTVTIAGMRR